MKKIILSLTVAALFALASCQKDDDRVNAPQQAGASNNQEMIESPQSDLNYQNDPPQLKISSSTILNASNANQIPSQMFGVNPIYKTYYTHIKQRPGECSWTSYVICISDIVAANNNFCYPTTINTVKNRCVSHANAIGINEFRIDNLNWYAGAYDASKIGWSLVSKSSKFAAIKEMLNHINTYRTPFLVVSSIGGTGHYRVVFSIDWKKGESGSTIYYTDCNYPSGASPGVVSNPSFSANYRSMDLTQFMSTMTGSFASYYNMLFMWPK